MTDSVATRRAMRRSIADGNRRTDVQGLRTVAALLVAVYHIWTHRISGAVDVFFVVSAFVMMQSVLREIERSGGLHLGRFLRNLLFRMAPLAWIVIGGTMLAAILILPVTTWTTSATQALSAMSFSINYFLGFESIAYLGDEANASLFQHFWAMAVQVQFYLLFPLLVLLALAIARRSGRDTRRVLGAVLAILLAASFVYAAISVDRNQSFAYFDTAARAWQFAAGALAAVALPALRLPRLLGIAAAALGLLALVSLGALVDVTTSFPGPLAVIPVGAALLILVGGVTGHGAGASRLLAARPLVAAADYSFGFYLWHWPVLAIYRQVNDLTTLGLLDGLGVITLAAALAFVSQRWLEGPVRAAARRASDARTWRRPVAALAAFAVVPALAVGGVNAHVSWLLSNTPDDNPGAAVVAEQSVSLSPFADVQPPLVMLANGQWDEWGQHCEDQSAPDGSGFQRCEAGDPGAPLRIAAIGDSHTQIWLTAFAESIDQGNVHIVSYYRGACPLSTNGGDKLGEEHDDAPGCRAANLARIAMAIDERPDLVVTSSNIARGGSPHVNITEGFVEAVQLLTAESIPVIGFRDPPRHSEAFAGCLEATGMDVDSCAVPSEIVLDPTPFDDVLPASLQEDPSFLALDLTDLLCFDGLCPAVIGGVIPYVDDNHLTRSYVTTMAPYLLSGVSGLADSMGVRIPPDL